MEDLNKNQIILLAILASFVTSIATGIITASLLQVAPVEVTRTINNIVEKAVKQIVPADTTSSKTKEVTTTIVVSEEDSITDSISKNAKSIVRIKERDTIANLTTFYGIGIVVDKNASIVAVRRPITDANKYFALLGDGSEVSLTPTGIDKKTNFIIFKFSDPLSTSTKNALAVINFSNTDPKLGQTVISLGGYGSNVSSVGRITSLDIKDETVGTTTSKVLVNISTDVSIKDLVSGSPLLNLSGEIIGIKLFDDSSKLFTPTKILQTELETLKDTPQT